MKVSEIIGELSVSTCQMLSNLRTDKIGTVVPVADKWQRADLLKLRVIGPNDGLTIKGSAVVCKLRADNIPF